MHKQWACDWTLQVGDHEVECQPDFRLYLHSTLSPHEVAPELAAYVSLVSWQLSRNDVSEELLDRFMIKEKQRLNDEKDALMQVCNAIENCVCVKP